MNLFERARFFRTKKRLGQNFLVNPDVIEEIIDYAQITKDDTIIEIDSDAHIAAFKKPSFRDLCRKSEDAQTFGTHIKNFYRSDFHSL